MIHFYIPIICCFYYHLSMPIKRPQKSPSGSPQPAVSTFLSRRSGHLKFVDFPMKDGDFVIDSP